MGHPQFQEETVHYDTVHIFRCHHAGLDHLSTPTGVIAESQAKAAAAYGADQTWFLVQGSTVGIQVGVNNQRRAPSSCVCCARCYSLVLPCLPGPQRLLMVVLHYYSA